MNRKEKLPLGQFNSKGSIVVKMEITKLKDVVLSENSYVAEALQVSDRKTSNSMLYSSIFYALFFSLFHEFFYEKLDDYSDMLIVGWGCVITSITAWQAGYAYVYFKQCFIKPEIRNFCEKEPSFLFCISGCIHNWFFLAMHMVFHVIASFIIFRTTDYYHVLASSLGDFERQVQGQYMEDVFNNVSVMPSTIQGFRILIELCYLLLVLLLTLVQRHLYSIEQFVGKIILKVVVDENETSSSYNTIKYDGISIVKTDGSIIPIDLRKDLLRFLDGAVFVTGLKPGEWKSGFRQNEVAKIVVDGNSIHKEIVFDSASQHWQCTK